MNDEFNKLDTFMRQHRPEAKLPQKQPPTSSSLQWGIPALAVVLMVLVVSGHFWRQSELNAEAAVLAESMEWEVEIDLEEEEVGAYIALAE